MELIQQRIAANHANAQTLATLRDTLLSRLISGQLRLLEAEVLLEPAGNARSIHVPTNMHRKTMISICVTGNMHKNPISYTCGNQRRCDDSR